MNRTTLGLTLSAFVVVGFVLWVSGMPKPTDSTLSAAVVADLAAAHSVSDPAATVPAPPPGAVVSDEWLLSVAGQTGIPSRALQAYADAAIVQQAVTPECGLGWNLLAAIGEVASQHGAMAGARIGADGELTHDLRGPVLDGSDSPAVRDTDNGALDGDASWDRAVGPLQLLPQTWSRFSVDGNGDGVADPDNIDDAARTAAALLCDGGGALATRDGWTAALTRYDPDGDYLLAVDAQAERYAAAHPQ